MSERPYNPADTHAHNAEVRRKQGHENAHTRKFPSWIWVCDKFTPGSAPFKLACRRCGKVKEAHK